MTTAFNAATRVIRAATTRQAAVKCDGASADRLTNAGMIDDNLDLGDGTGNEEFVVYRNAGNDVITDFKDNLTI